MSRFSLSGLEAFRAVARQGSIRAAAASLQLEPSTVSHQLKTFEEHLGVTLFVRTTRSVSLTDAGRVLLQSALPAMAQIEDALDRSRQVGAVRKGALRISMPYIAFQMVLADRLSDFQQRYPGITLDCSFSDQLVDIAAEGFHAGIRFGGRIQDGMVTVAITKPVEAVVVASPQYLKKHGIPGKPPELLKHNCIRYRFIKSQRIADWDFSDANGHYTVDVSGDFIADLQVAILDRVSAGAGLAQLPLAFVKNHLKAKKLIRLPPAFSYRYPALYLYYPQENRRTETLRAFIEFFRCRR